MKTYQQFTQLDERAFSPAGQAARAKMRQQNELNRQKKEKGGALALRPADKGAAIVRQKQGGTGKEAVGATKDSRVNPRDQSKQPPKVGGFKRPTSARMNSQGRKNAIEKYKAKSKKSGFGAGFKQGMGGDAFSKDDSTRRKTRNELGKKTANFVKSVPGKVAGKLRNGGTPGRVQTAKAGNLSGGAFTSKFSR